MLKRNETPPPLWVYNVFIYIGFVSFGVGLFPILGWYTVAFTVGVFLITGAVLAILASD